MVRRLLALDRHPHLFLARRRLARLLGGLCCLRRRSLPTDALPQRLHQIDHVFAFGPLLRADGLACALLVDQVDQRGLVVILEFLGVERARLLVDDVPCEVEHVLGDFDVLDLVEVLLLGADLVGVAQQRTDETLLQRLERDNVLAVGENHAADRHLVHLADGLADYREGVVADLAVWTQIVGADQVARIDLGSVHELIDLDGARGL